jgi:hypothetical protein
MALAVDADKEGEYNRTLVLIWPLARFAERLRPILTEFEAGNQQQ